MAGGVAMNGGGQAAGLWCSPRRANLVAEVGGVVARGTGPFAI